LSQNNPSFFAVHNLMLSESDVASCFIPSTSCFISFHFISHEILQPTFLVTKGKMWAKGVQISPKLQLSQPNLGQINPIVTAT